MKKYGLIAALGLILATNVFVFAGVLYNRSGEPDAELVLTEREVPLARQEEENTGMFLRLEWKMPGFRVPGVYTSEPSWLNREILEQIGFKTDRPLEDTQSHSYYRHQLPRPAWIVLEFDGPTWKQWESDAQQFIETKNKKMENEKRESRHKGDALIPLKRDSRVQIEQIKFQLVTHTRLFAIDAGPDPILLRQKYPDRSTYLITEGVIRINVSYYRKSDSNNKRKNRAFLNGYIQKILIDSIHIPNSYRSFFQQQVPKRPYSAYYLPKGKTIEDLKPRYTVALKYGKKYQPWITDIKPLSE